MRRTRMAQRAACPYLVEPMVDRLWMYPMSIYCTSGARTRVPGATKTAEVCMDPAHTRCPGYVAARRATPSCIRESLDLQD
jgi:hypothetical protein